MNKESSKLSDRLRTRRIEIALTEAEYEVLEKAANGSKSEYIRKVLFGGSVPLNPRLNDPKKPNPMKIVK